MSSWLDLSNSSNKLKQTYVSGFIDISGDGVIVRNGAIQLFDEINPITPGFTINSKSMNIYDGVSNYYDISNSKLIFLKDVSENIQNRLDDLISRTQYISTDLNNNRIAISIDTSLNNQLLVGGNTILNAHLQVNSTTTLSGDLLVTGNIIGNIKIGGNTIIDNDLNLGGNANIGGAVISNGIIVNGHILPTIGNTFNIGTETNPFNSLYINKGTVYFTDNQSDGITKTAASLSYEPSKKGLTLSRKPIRPTDPTPPVEDIVVSINGNTGLGTSNPSYTLDVSGTTNLYGNVIVNDILYAGKDISINSGVFIAKDASLNANLYVNNNTLLNGELIVNSDTSLNGNVTINKDLIVNGNLVVKQYTQNDIINTITTNVFSINEDLSLNGHLSIGGDASFSNDVTIAGNLITHYPANSIPQSAIKGGVGGIYIPTEVTTFDNDMFALIKDFQPGTTLIDASVNGNLSVSGTSKLSGNVIIGNELTITGNVTIIKDVNITGNLITNYSDKSIPLSALKGNISDLGGGSFYTPTEVTTFDDDQFALLKEFNDGTKAAKDASVIGNLTVGSNVYLNANVFIKGDLSMIGNIYVPTQALDDSSDKIATTSYVQNTLFRQFIP